MSNKKLLVLSREKLKGLDTTEFSSVTYSDPQHWKQSGVRNMFTHICSPFDDNAKTAYEKNGAIVVEFEVGTDDSQEEQKQPKQRKQRVKKEKEDSTEQEAS